MDKGKGHKWPSLILVGDFHLRDDQPISRTDNFWETQWHKVSFIRGLQEKYICPVIHPGDLFDTWKPSLRLLSKTILELPFDFKTIYGNHDLPQHNLDLVDKTGIKVLEAAEAVEVLPGAHWGQEPEGMSLMIDGRRILVWHVTAYGKNPHWFEGPTASDILKAYADYDLIVTGHIHQTLVVEKKDRLLVNPGSLSRQESDAKNHEPCIYLWYAEDNTVECVVIPHEKGVVVETEKSQESKARDARIDAFIEKLQPTSGPSVSFEANIESLTQKGVRRQVKEIIYKAIDKEEK